MSQLTEPAVAYLAFKAAQKLYGKDISALPPSEFERVQSMAKNQHELEVRVLTAPEARDAMVPTSTLDAAMQEIRGRYQSDEEFDSDLARNGLDEASFSAALERELRVEAILEKVATESSKVTDTDVELYYLYHPNQFRRPETRFARHILITINETIAENTRVTARLRIEAIAMRLAKEPQRFEEQALKHSECPTALDGGKLGDLPRGKLFPVLDSALFEMQAGEVSGVLESELGFHILSCDAITEANVLTINEARPHIRSVLEKKRKRAFQQEWLKNLRVAKTAG